MSKKSEKLLKDDTMRNDFNYYDGKIVAPITFRNCPQEFFSIVAVFEEDCNFNLKEFYTDGGRLFIKGYDLKAHEYNRLVLRYGNGRLTVAVVHFVHKRQGSMTRLYNILKRIRKKYKLEPIVMEQCLTEQMQEWCLKNGLVRRNEDTHDYVEVK